MENVSRASEKQGREEEMRYSVKILEMFEFGCLEETMSKPTTTKWVDVVKTDEGLELVRCRLVASS